MTQDVFDVPEKVVITPNVSIAPQTAVKVNINIKDNARIIRDIFYHAQGSEYVSITDKVLTSSFEWDIWLFNGHVSQTVVIDKIEVIFDIRR